jgi:hypothetical protein
MAATTRMSMINRQPQFQFFYYLTKRLMDHTLSLPEFHRKNDQIDLSGRTIASMTGILTAQEFTKVCQKKPVPFNNAVTDILCMHAESRTKKKTTSQFCTVELYSNDDNMLIVENKNDCVNGSWSEHHEHWVESVMGIGRCRFLPIPLRTSRFPVPMPESFEP